VRKDTPELEDSFEQSTVRTAEFNATLKSGTKFSRIPLPKGEGDANRQMGGGGGVHYENCLPSFHPSPYPLPSGEEFARKRFPFWTALVYDRPCTDLRIAPSSVASQPDALQQF